MYGLDADLIFLCLSTNCQNMFLLREANEMEKNVSKDVLNYVSIDIMKEITKKLNLNVEVKKKIINLLKSKLPSHEIDVPNPKFKGPF